ncbi:MAG: glycosyltransferase family 4 protein [Proteobacteria bacterium]|nr:glycosyltransferase family 4 protein [Pseudomonadota bacterium]
MSDEHGQVTIESGGAKAYRPAVLQVLPRLVSGGVERGTADIAAAVAGAGWRSLVASAGGPMVRLIDRAGARHITLPLDSKNPFVMRANVHRLARLIREHGVDIVHARSRAPAWSAEAAARLEGAHFVTTVHGTYSIRSVLKRHYNKVMTRGERVIAISNFIASQIQETYHVAPEKIRVIHRGVDLAEFDPLRVTDERMIHFAGRWRLPDGMKIILLPGRLSRWKGQRVLIEALKRLGRRDVSCLLLGAGQGHGAYQRRIEAQIKRARLQDVVRILDHCPDMAAAYKLSDVVVSASTRPEAFGRVVAEAQAMGRPVIATDHGGTLETVIRDETGWLVPPGDPDALAAALDKALSLDGAARERLAQRAMAHIRQHFTNDEMCQKTLAVYAEVMNSGDGGKGTAAP